MIWGLKGMAGGAAYGSQMKALLDAQAPMQTTFMDALFGFIGTLITGVIVSLVAAAFLKGKPAGDQIVIAAP